MSIFGVGNFRIEDLHIVLSKGEDCVYDINVDFIGVFYSSYLEELVEDYLTKLHCALIGSGVSRVRLSFERLNHIDSRGLGLLISWFKKINKEPSDSVYTVHIYFNERLMIHQVSFCMMKDIFPNIVNIETNFI